MKKITLSAIIIFILVITTVFIGSNLNTKKIVKTKPLQNTNTISAQDNNPVVNTKQFINTTKTKPNETSDNTSTTSKENDHINSPNININNLEQTSKDSFTIDEISIHNSKDDCYLIINNKVYDVSSYISEGYHPAGSRIIISYCGNEVTGIFASIHSNRAWDLLKKYKIGIITINKPDTTFQVLTAISDALKKANPDAEIVKVSPKKNFYVAKIIYKGKLYEVHIDNNGHIIKEEIEDEESSWSLWENDNDDKTKKSNL